MLFESVFNMAPDAVNAPNNHLSFRWSEISIQRLEISFKSRNISRDQTKIEKAFFYADTAVAEWMLHADIMKLTRKEFKIQFFIQAIDYRGLGAHMLIPKRPYESIGGFLKRAYKAYLEYGLTEQEFESMLRLKISTLEELDAINRIIDQRGFFKKKPIIEKILDEEKIIYFNQKKMINQENARMRLERKLKESNKLPMNNLAENNKGLPLIEVTIEGDKHKAIKDTGSEKNIIDKKLIA